MPSIFRAGRVARNERYYEELESALRAGGRPYLSLSLVYERLADEEERRRMLRFLDVAERPEFQGSDLEAELYADDP